MNAAAQMDRDGGGSGAGNGPLWATMASADRQAAQRPSAGPARRLALFGLPPALAEPLTMLAEILGWQVASFPAGPAVSPPALLCLAMLPADDAGKSTAAPPPVVAWSPEIHLNEHISRAGLSIMDQPLCITRVEQMLEAIVCAP